MRQYYAAGPAGGGGVSAIVGTLLVVDADLLYEV